MKATFDIPDEIYRRVKARSALEGRPLRSVAIELFQQWLNEPAQTAEVPAPASAPAEQDSPWLAITRRYVRPGMNHDLESMRSAIAAGWAAEAAGKFNASGK